MKKHLNNEDARQDKNNTNKEALETKGFVIIFLGVVCITIGIILFSLISNFNNQTFVALLAVFLLMVGLIIPPILVMRIKDKIKKEYKTYKNTERSTSPQPTNVPKCPTCGSTDISPISTGSRVGSIVMWGIFSNKIRKSFECKNCKYMW